MEELIICRTCGPKPKSAFNTHKTRGFQSQCKKCRSDYTKQHYKQNKEDYIERARKRNKIQREANQSRVIEYLKSHPCEACGETDLVVLDFHHKDPQQKEFQVASAVAWLTWERLEKEIKKCEVLCANDHRRRHAKENKIYRFMGRSG